MGSIQGQPGAGLPRLQHFWRGPVLCGGRVRAAALQAGVCGPALPRADAGAGQWAGPGRQRGQSVRAQHWRAAAGGRQVTLHPSLGRRRRLQPGPQLPHPGSEQPSCIMSAPAAHTLVKISAATWEQTVAAVHIEIRHSVRHTLLCTCNGPAHILTRPAQAAL